MLLRIALWLMMVSPSFVLATEYVLDQNPNMEQYLQRAILFPGRVGQVKLYLSHVDDIPMEAEFKRSLKDRYHQMWEKGFVSVNNAGLPINQKMDLYKMARFMTKKEKQLVKWRLPLKRFSDLKMRYVGTIQVMQNYISRAFYYKEHKLIVVENRHDPKLDRFEFPIEMINTQVGGVPAMLVPYLTKERRMVALINWIKGNTLYEVYWDQQQVKDVPYEEMWSLVSAITSARS